MFWKFAIVQGVDLSSLSIFSAVVRIKEIALEDTRNWRIVEVELSYYHSS
jgi:hypothetical protein